VPENVDFSLFRCIFLAHILKSTHESWLVIFQTIHFGLKFDWSPSDFSFLVGRGLDGKEVRATYISKTDKHRLK